MENVSNLRNVLRKGLISMATAALVVVLSAIPVASETAAWSQENNPEVIDCSIQGDMDSDGAISVRCGGNDCDDNDANRYPGNTEICNGGYDEDCDPETGGTTDDDGDGYYNSNCY